MEVRNQTVWCTLSIAPPTPPGTFREYSTETAGRGNVMFRKLTNSAAEFSPEGSFHGVPSKMTSRS